jgi:hypothetical protein
MTASGLSWSVDALVAQRLGIDYRKNRAMCDALRTANMEWERCHFIEDAGSPEHIKHLVTAARDARDTASRQPQQQDRFANQRGTEPLWRQGRQRFMDPANVRPGESKDRKHVSMDGAVDTGVSFAHPVKKMRQYDVPEGGGVFPQKAKEDLETEPFGRSSRLRKGGWASDPHEGNIRSKRMSREAPIVDPRSRYRPSVAADAPELEPVEVDISEGHSGETQKERWRRAVEESRAVRRQERGDTRVIEYGDGSCGVLIDD